jgi:hypothetical protein
MWSGLIEVHHICVEETVELLLMQDQEVIQACSPDAAQKKHTSCLMERRRPDTEEIAPS